MQKEKWLIRNKRADFYGIGEKYGISPIIARIIRNRDVIEDEDINIYLNGTLDNMHSAWLFKNMDNAVNIMNIKINQGNKIRIICDYDVDGICSGYILLDGLTNAGADVDIVVPHRVEDGYGINEKLIDDAVNAGIDTIITCDNGIAAVEAIRHAKELGLTVIVTDHHEVQYEVVGEQKTYNLPQADAIVDHKQPDCGYPFKELCGASVAYKFMQALYDSRGIDLTSVKKYLEYAAVATICDVVDLIGENRIITRYGLEMVRKTNNLGLNALIEECGLDKPSISAFHIGFVIGPCLNASGRLDTAKKAIELLRCGSAERAGHLAAELKKMNDERKRLTEEGVEQACILAQQQEKDRVLVIYLEDCHESIAGIIAGRVRERFNKPVIVLTRTENGIKGSGRSIESYDMFGELLKVKHLLTKFGGHKMAAGLSLEEKNVTLLRKMINEACTLTDDDMVPKIWIDTELPLQYITYGLVEQLSILEPFGKGNEKPVFAARDLRVKRIRLLGKEGNVLKLELAAPSGCVMEGICFNKSREFVDFVKDTYGAEELAKINHGQPNNVVIKILFYPNINVYNGKTTLQLVVQSFC